MSKSKKTAATAPLLIEGNNLGVAWATLLLHVIEHPGTEVAPLVLSLHGFDKRGCISEDRELRVVLDQLLAAKDKDSSENVAFTIFPERYWRIVGQDRHKLFDLYAKSFERMKAMKKRQNRRGLYFQRMTMYEGAPCGGNQLEWVLSQFEGRTNVRRSMLQASIFDPTVDHVADAQLGFPCLQNVSFEPTVAGLVLNAFYATQQLFDKSYGNYLGLSHLGAFMAHEMKLPLARLNVFVGVAKLERVTKTDTELKPLVDIARSLVHKTDVL